jgi:hypothetical protein
MRTFADIQQEPGFKKFLDSPLGTLYMILDDSGVPRIMVRHFDSVLPPSSVQAYADLVAAVRRWVEKHPQLASLVEVQPLIEIGRDFITRSYHIYYGSLNAYVDWEDPPEPPVELEQMHNLLRMEMGSAQTTREQIVETVVTQSLLEPTSKTYFDESKKKFIVLEPKVTKADVERWMNA